MRETFGYHLYACGKDRPPEEIIVGGNKYRFNEVLKHDFFALTALYKSHNQQHLTELPCPGKVVLKLSRQQHFLGIPFLWFGEMLCNYEVHNLECLMGISGTPRLLSRYGKTGFIYEYIEGCSLAEAKKLPGDFFDEFLKLLQQIHKRNMIYLDMNKRDNILLGDDNKPHLIDFQISLHIGENPLISRRVSRCLREKLQKADLYHIFKHKRRLCPELLRPEELDMARAKGGLIQLHRAVATPLRKLRRGLLKYLAVKGLMVEENKAYFRN